MLSLVLVLVAAFSPQARTACLNGAPLIQRNKFTCGNRQYIVDYHNKIRNYVASGRIESQPKAANMVELRWSETLATLAQKRADTCLFEHGDLELNGERIGQNLAIVLSSRNDLRLNITYMMDIWYNEVFQYGYKEGFEPNSGHYSQLIWGTTREVGCGYTYYKENNWYKMYFVCDYYPPGNWIGEKPYVYGKTSCKEYGLRNSRRYSKLCEVDDKEIGLCKAEKPDKELPQAASNASIPETNDLDNRFDSSNGTADAEDESVSEESGGVNGDDEVVTANYDASEEPDGYQSVNETEAGRNQTSGVGDSIGESEISTVGHACKSSAANFSSEVVADLESIVSQLSHLKFFISGHTNSSDFSSFKEYMSANNETSIGTDDDTEQDNITDSFRNYTLNMVNDSLKVAVKLSQIIRTKKCHELCNED